MQLKTVQWNVIIIIIIIILSLLLLLLSLVFFSMMVLIVGFTCPPTIHFKFVTKYDSVFYYKVRQLFLFQSVTSVITKCHSLILQSATEDSSVIL